jgi:glycosyltransferase involved in cell wall biosynthesis
MLLTKEHNVIPTYLTIPVRDCLEYTAQLVTTLLEQDDFDGLLVCDNGSIDETPLWLKYMVEEYPKLHTLDTKGWVLHQMWNYAIDWVRDMTDEEEYNIAFLNNDLEIGDQFSSSLSKMLRAYPLFAIGPNYDDRHIEGDIQLVNGICAGKYDGTGGLPGFAFMMRGEYFDVEIPRFDEEFSWWCGDIELTVHMDKLRPTMGMGYAVTNRTWCRHLDGGSVTSRAHPFDAHADLAVWHKKYN